MTDSRELRAGPLTLLFEAGGIRYVRWGTREILRRVYVAVRDRAWDTLPTEISNFKLDARAGSFEIAFDARSRRDEIDFAWRGSVSGDAKGTVVFRMDGEARTSFFRNRVGVCVLHPARECAGRPCAVTHSDGRVEAGTFPSAISAHQPFFDIRAISHEVAPGLRAEVRLEGDVFEMEDQRNWTDGSYKIYSTPLRLPIPVRLEAGTRVVHQVTLALRGEAPAPAAAEGPVRFSLADRLPVPLPVLGRTSPGPAAAHLRVDLRGADAIRFFEAAARAREMGAELEVALHLAEEVELLRLPLMAAEAKVRLARVLVFPTTEEWICQARRHLPGIPIGGGSETHFAELNRRRPPVDLLDFVTFPAHSQAHAADERTIVENLEPLGGAVENARRLSADRPVFVTPLGFGGKPDPREAAPLGACWTLVSVKYLAEACAAGATYAGGSAAVLDEVGEFAGGEVLPTLSSDPLRVDGLALRKGGKARVFLANLTPGPERALFEGRAFELKPYEIARVDR